MDGMPRHLAHKWAAMRDCVRRGREHRYGARQSEYHYTKDRSLLAAELAGLEAEERSAEVVNFKKHHDGGM